MEFALCSRGLTIEEQITYQSYMIAYGVVEDEEVKRQMGRRGLRPNYDNLAELIDETFPPEIKIKFIQKLLHADSPEKADLKLLGVDSPEEGAQKILNVSSLEEGAQKLLRADSLEEAVLKLARMKKQPKELLEFLRRNLEVSVE